MRLQKWDPSIMLPELHRIWAKLSLFVVPLIILLSLRSSPANFGHSLSRYGAKNNLQDGPELSGLPRIGNITRPSSEPQQENGLFSLLATSFTTNLWTYQQFLAQLGETSRSVRPSFIEFKRMLIKEGKLLDRSLQIGANLQQLRG